MRPDKQLASLLGLTDAASTLSEALPAGRTRRRRPGSGIVGQTMQFHGTADRYTLAAVTPAATTVATLYSNATTATTNPAVTLRTVGSGEAAAFAFDLARSIVYTRQGNPAWAGDERDGVAPVRSDDLFYGAKAGDVQPDWVDLGKVAIPQADEQQRLLANLILKMNADRKPLPRFWYFPRGEKAVVVMAVRQPRQRERRDPLRGRRGGQPRRLLGGGLGVHPLDRRTSTPVRCPTTRPPSSGRTRGSRSAST